MPTKKQPPGLIIAYAGQECLIGVDRLAVGTGPKAYYVPIETIRAARDMIKALEAVVGVYEDRDDAPIYAIRARAALSAAKAPTPQGPSPAAPKGKD